MVKARQLQKHIWTMETMKVNLGELRSKLINRWIDLFSEDFKLVDSAGILNEVDPTIIFNNCSICIFKNNFVENREFEDYIVIQDCLRTNTYKQIHDLDMYKWTANITMLGGYKTVSNNLTHDLRDLIKRQYEFLIPFISEDLKLILQVSKEYYNDYKFIESNDNVKIEIIDTDDLKWKYGLSEMRGIGSEWIFENNETRFYFGNIIVIYNNETPYGIDFGGSLEVLVQNILGKEHKIYGCSYAKSSLLDIIDKSDDHCQLIDCLATLLLIYDSTNSLEKISISFEQSLYKYLYAAACLSIITNFEHSMLEFIMEELSEDLLPSNKIEKKHSNKLLNQLDELIKMLKEKSFHYGFMDYNKLTNLEKKTFKILGYV